MDEPTPSQPFVAYPRTGELVLDPESGDRLQALYQVHVGSSLLFGLNIVLMVAGGVTGLLSFDMLPITGAFLLLISSFIGCIAYLYTKKIGYGLKWSSKGPVAAAVLVGLTAFSFGLIRFGFLRSLTWSGIQKYGVRQSWYGFRHKDVTARVNEHKAAQALSAPK